MRLHLAGMTIALVLSMGFSAASAEGAHRLAQVSAPAAPAEQKLVGVAAWGQLVGNSITGKEDDETLVEYYAFVLNLRALRALQYRRVLMPSARCS